MLDVCIANSGETQLFWCLYWSYIHRYFKKRLGMLVAFQVVFLWEEPHLFIQRYRNSQLLVYSLGLCITSDALFGLCIGLDGI